MPAMNRNVLAFLMAVLVSFVVGTMVPAARGTEYRLDTGDNANLRTIVNQHATFLNELKADFNLLRAQVLNSAGEDADVTEGTNANTIKTTDACSYTIAGVIYEKAATDNIAMDAVSAQADLTYRLYLVSINAAGTVAITGGTAVATDTAVLPALPADSAPLAYFKIATSGATFTSGTTDLSAAGITDTFFDLGVVDSGASASTVIANAAAHTARVN